MDTTLDRFLVLNHFEKFTSFYLYITIRQYFLFLFCTNCGSLGFPYKLLIILDYIYSVNHYLLRYKDKNNFSNTF